MSYRILLVGGGSGGHVYPLVAVANSLRKRAQVLGVALEMLAIGEGEFLTRAASEANIGFKTIMSGKMRRYFSFLNFVDLLKLPIGLIQSLWYIFWFMPDVVFVKGGHASLMPAIASRIYAIPVFIHETDSVPGKTNLFLSKLAKKIFISFQSSAKYFGAEKVLFTGNPVRPEIAMGDRTAAMQFFSFNSSKKTIFVFGGSQGSKVLNDAILAALPSIVDEFQIIHQCGDANFKDVKAEYDRLVVEGAASYGPGISASYKFFPFFDRNQLAMAYAACDVVLARAGGSIFEIALVAKPAVLVPLENSAGDHQMENALEFSKFGAVMIEERNLTTHVLFNEIRNILKPENYSAISNRIKQFAVPDAADKIAEGLLNK